MAISFLRHHLEVFLCFVKAKLSDMWIEMGILKSAAKTACTLAVVLQCVPVTAVNHLITL